MCQPSPAGRGCWQPAEEGGEENTWILGFRRRNEVPESPGRPFLGQGPGGRGSGGGFGLKIQPWRTPSSASLQDGDPQEELSSPPALPSGQWLPPEPATFRGLLVHRWEAEPFTHLRPL